MESRLPILQKKQAVTKFLRIVSPPLDEGIMWSIIKIAPVLGVAPQYWQVKLSLSRILNLILSGVFVPLFLWVLSGFGNVGILSIKRNAFCIPPKVTSYRALPGNPSIFLNSHALILRPLRMQASSSFESKYSSDIMSDLRFLWFMVVIITPYLIISKSYFLYLNPRSPFLLLTLRGAIRRKAQGERNGRRNSYDRSRGRNSG